MTSNELFAALLAAALNPEHPASVPNTPKAPAQKPTSKVDAERKAQIFAECAKDTKLMFDALCNVGFSPEHAYGLTVAMIGKK